MKRFYLSMLLPLLLLSLGVSSVRAGTTVESALNGQSISAGGSSQFFWGPLFSQTSISMSGSANSNYPQLFAGGAISGSGGAIYPNYCSPGPDQGPGAIIYPSAVPVYQWYCHAPVAPLPPIDFNAYKALAQSEGNSCNGAPCYNAAASPSFSGIYDATCVVGASPKVWYFEGSPTFSGGTYFCGILIAQGDIKFTGSGAGNTTVAPPANAWQQYQVNTPNGSAHPQGDTSAQDEYPGDAGLHSVKPFNFAAGGGGFNGKQVTFHGYLYASGGYTTNGGNLIVGAVQQGPNAPSSTGGGSTIFFEPQTIITPPPPPPPSNTVATPVITPDGGNFNDPVAVTIQDSTPEASIYYTLDGSTPNGSKTLYTGPFILSENTIVKAIGVLSGMNDSAVATAAFTFISVPHPPNPSLTVVVNPSAVTLGPTQTQTFNALVSGSGVTNPNVRWSISPNMGTLTGNNSTATLYTAPASISATQTVTLTAVSLQNNFTYGTATITLQPTAPPPPTTQANLSITKTANPDPVNVGQNLTYTLTLGNAGPDSALNTMVTDALPASVNYVSATPSQGSCSLSGHTLSCNLGTLATGVSPIVTIVVTPTVAGALTNTASVASGTSDPNLNNNVASVTSNVQSASSNPVPVLSSLSPNSATAGSAGFTLTANGSNFISGSVLQWNNTSRTTTFVSGTQLTATISAADIASAGSAIVTIVNPAPGGGISNALTFTIISGGGTGNPVLSRITVSPPNATVLTGGTQGFSAVGFDQNNNPMTGISFNWSVTGSNQNTVTPNSGTSTTFTAGSQVGTFVITASNGNISGTATVLVQSSSGCQLDHINVTPASAVISPSETVQFQAFAIDSCGQTIQGAIFQWAITLGGGDGSSISTSGGLFSPSHSLQNNTQYTITASYGGKSGPAQVTVLVRSASGSVDLSNAKAYPVPYKSTSGLPGVTFSGLAAGTHIRIFTADSILVWTLTSTSSGNVLWPVINSDGNKVASGVYFYILDNSGKTKKGKLVIIQ